MKFFAKPFPFQTVSGDPFPNSKYYEMGDYKIHYRIDPAKTVTPVAKAFMIHGFACMGIPRYILTDNMKSVVLHRDFEGNPVWQKDYEAFMKAVGFRTKLCKPPASLYQR